MDHELAGLDVVRRRLDGFEHVGRQERLVVLVLGVADPVLAEAQHGDAGLPGAVLGGGEAVLHGDVDVLQHGREDVAGEQAVLVGIDADAELARVRRRLEHAVPGSAGGVVDHVGAAVDLGLRELPALHRVVPGVGRGAGHVLQHLDLRVGVFRPLDVAAAEAVDQRDVHAAHEAELAGLGRHGAEQAHQERALALLEQDRLDVGLVNHGVDDGEFGVGELGRHLLHGAGLAEADRYDGGEAVLGEAAHRLLALGVVLDLEVAERDAGRLLEGFGPVEGALVEALVELAAEVVDQRRLDVGRPGRALGHAGDQQARARHQCRDSAPVHRAGPRPRRPRSALG